MRTAVYESGPEGALVYRKPSRGRVDPRRGGGHRWNLAFPHGPGVRRRDGAVGHALCACPPPQRGSAALANGAPDILSVALDADYGSHEAFTRAFRDHFGVTPEAVRGSKHLDNLQLQEPITMDSTVIDNLQPPRFATGKPLLVAGVGERYTCESAAGIPGQWQRFHQSVENIPGRIGKVAYGVCCNGDDAGNFDYIAGVEVSDFSDLPREFSRVRIPEARYAVFSHREHISTIRRTVNTIWNQWLPASGLKAADAPNFERYDENFDPLTGNGGLEIWIPVKD
jgi:AraC family transcriptional regulator